MLAHHRPESRGTGFAALWIALQVVITAAAAVNGLWLGPGLAQTFRAAFAALNGQTAPQVSWLAPVAEVWASVVGVVTAFLIGAILLRWRRMTLVASVWSTAVALLAVMSVAEFGFDWITVPVLASAAVLVPAVHQHSSRAA